MDLSILDEFQWGNLEQAYGSAKNAPISLRAIASDDEDERDEAIYGFLHSEACHQYTTYSCTPYVVRFVLHIITNKEFDSLTLKEILGFIHACTYNAKTINELRLEILSGIECYRKYSTHEDSGIKGQAQSLLGFCSKYEA